MAMAIELSFAGAVAGVDLPPWRLECLGGVALPALESTLAGVLPVAVEALPAVAAAEAPPAVTAAEGADASAGGGTLPIEIAACGSPVSGEPGATLATA